MACSSFGLPQQPCHGTLDTRRIRRKNGSTPSARGAAPVGPVMTTGLLLDLSIPADWTRIELVRKAVGFCVWAVFGRGDLRDSLSMVSAELLENAMKYSTPEREVRLAIAQDDGKLVVSVTNEVEATSRHLASLKERLAWIRGYASAADAYMAALAEVFDNKEGEPTGEGGLGMVRIAYEGGCELSCDVSVPGKVTVRAARALPSPGNVA